MRKWGYSWVSLKDEWLSLIHDNVLLVANDTLIVDPKTDMDRKLLNYYVAIFMTKKEAVAFAKKLRSHKDCWSIQIYPKGDRHLSANMWFHVKDEDRLKDVDEEIMEHQEKIDELCEEREAIVLNQKV